MKEWTPLETVWPSGALLVGVLVTLWLARREFGLTRRDRLPMGGLLLGAFLVRWLWLPVVARQFPDGHEADYFDRFTGLVEPTRGGTVMYPSMQWFWYGLGKVLPHETWVPSLVMVAVGCLGIGLLVLALRRLTCPELAWTAGVLLALHPVHAAWSSSAYNVVLPFTLGILGFVAAAAYVSRHRPPESLLWLSCLALGLAVTTRLDSVVLAGPVLLLLLLARPPGVPWKRAMKDRARHLAAPIVAASLVAMSVHPLLQVSGTQAPSELPGAGERALAFEINWNLVDVHLPFDGPLGLLLLLLGTLLAGRRWPLLTAALALGALGNHLLMATFNDYADRHALMSHLGVVYVLAAGGWSMVEGRGAQVCRAIPVIGLGISVLGLVDMRERFYGTDDSFNQMLAEGEWGELPRLSLEEASHRNGQSCGWVSEASQARIEPGLSHFNLVQPAEAQTHRGPDGCLRWCADVQDWRWSSRSVRDRSLRLIHLYQLEAVGVVGESDGYQCLVLDIGERSVGGADRIPDWLGPRRFP